MAKISARDAFEMERIRTADGFVYILRSDGVILRKRLGGTYKVYLTRKHCEMMDRDRKARGFASVWNALKGQAQMAATIQRTIGRA